MSHARLNPDDQKFYDFQLQHHCGALQYREDYVTHLFFCSIIILKLLGISFHSSHAMLITRLLLKYSCPLQMSYVQIFQSLQTLLIAIVHVRDAKHVYRVSLGLKTYLSFSHAFPQA